MNNWLKWGFVGIALLLGIPAIAQDALTGTWSVVATADGLDTCEGDDIGGTWQWLISVKDDGEVTISVLGETKFTRLTGRFGGNGYRFRGTGNRPIPLTAVGRIYPTVVDVMKLEQGQLVGERLHSSVRSVGNGMVEVACISRARITATQLAGPGMQQPKASPPVVRPPTEKVEAPTILPPKLTPWKK